MRSNKKTVMLRLYGRTRAYYTDNNDYMVVCDFILKTLHRHGEMELTALIEQANAELDRRVSNDIGWLILTVKRDLETKGILRNSKAIFPGMIPVIQLRKKIAAYKAYKVA